MFIAYKQYFIVNLLILGIKKPLLHFLYTIYCKGAYKPIPEEKRMPIKLKYVRRRVRGTGSAGPQQMLIFWVLLIFRIINVGLKFLVTRKRLTYHVAITDGIACRPLNYGVWNACET